jgi:hypothetical protein
MRNRVAAGDCQQNGAIGAVGEKLVSKIRATDPVHMCFLFKVGATPHKSGMRSVELMMSEISPCLDSALGPIARDAAE